MRDVKAEVLNFWFIEIKPQQWFQKNEGFDRLVKERFSDAYDLAVQGIFDDWRETPEGALALVILLDQFPRNMFRNTPRSFATDTVALEVAKTAIEKSYDQVLTTQQKSFLYLPFEHSEKLEDQEMSLSLFEGIKNENPVAYDYAVQHYDIIKEFNRFPHRNKILSRPNTEQEERFLAQPGSGF